MDNPAATKAVPEPERKPVSFGDRLKREREKRGITLDDVSLSTKIGLRMLHALEEEKFQQLPGGIFNKGFVRAYARHLGIDEEQAVADYLEAAGESTPAEPPLDVSAPSRDEAKLKRAEPDVPWGTLAIVLLLLALGLSLWSYYTREVNTSPREAPVTAPPQSPVTPPAATPSNPSSPATGSGSAPGISPNGQLVRPQSLSAEPSAKIQADSPIANAVRNSGLVSSDAKTIPNQVKQTAAPVSTFVVLIEAEENSWVSITADGKTILEGTLIAPAVKAVKAQKQIVVKVGNVGGLSFAFNGKKIPSQGATGEVRILTFDPSGLQVTVPKAPS